jgi:uncharacterized hydrophobic protein (TIGR00271 family)
MLHLRIVAPPDRAEMALELLKRTSSVCNVVHVRGAARRPEGDLILSDVAREDASVVLSDLRELEIPKLGSITVEEIDTQLSDAAQRAEHAAAGAPSDAVVWEEIEARTSDTAELSATFLVFMVAAMLIASVGIFLDTPILIIGAMVVGPEFGPIAGFCVAAVDGRRELASRALLALAVGFPAGITAAFLASLVFKWTGITPEHFTDADHALSNVIANPDFFTFFIAFCAGVAGMLSLTSAKSGALMGVLISITTIPAAANIGVSAAYGDWSTWRGSLAQLAVNLAMILVAGLGTLAIQRAVYHRRRVAHLHDPSRAAAGLPVGRSLRGRVSGGAAERARRESRAPGEAPAGPGDS